jgi:hypothetical protein
MDISTISASGASGVQASLLALLNGNGNADSGSSDSLVSSLGSASDSVSISAAGRQASSNPFLADLDQLGKLISSGDTAGAKALLEKIEARHKAHDPSAASSSSSSSGTSSSDDMFAELEKALASGDLSSAKSALAKLEDQAKSQAPPPPPSSGKGLDATLLAAYLQNGTGTSSTS